MKEDLTGRRFGKLIVKERSPRVHHSHDSLWLCICDCGKTSEVFASNLKSGHTQSCGCLEIASRIRHGFARRGSTKAEYSTWEGMIQRCTNPKYPQYQDYGGRGIKVCERWRDFVNFFADMGTRPDPTLTLDRIDNNKGYEPGNCRWATRHEQRINSRPFDHRAAGLKAWQTRRA